MSSPSAPEKPSVLATPEYWNARYQTSTGTTPTHEWFRTYAALEPTFLTIHLFTPYPSHKNPRILHLGSGDSTIPTNLHARSYTNQLCLDFSPTIVALMSSHAPAGIAWQHGDVRAMPAVPSGSVDVAFDKGTMDAMIYGSAWDPPDEVRENVGKYLGEVGRVLRAGGVFLYVTYRQPHFIRPLLKGGGEEAWESVEVEVLGDEEGSSFDYYGWVLRKKGGG